MHLDKSRPVSAHVHDRFKYACVVQRGILAVGLVFGCGRIGFEGDGSGSTSHVEITPPVAISDPTKQAVCSAIVWNDNGWGITWGYYLDSHAYFARFDTAGIQQGQVVTISNSGVCGPMIWTGSEYVFAPEGSFCTDSWIEVYRLDANGGPLNSVIPASPTSENARYPSIAWNGSGFHLSWTLYSVTGGPDMIRVAQLDATGKSIGTAFTLSTSDSDRSTLLGTPPGSVAVWGEDKLARFATLSAGAVAYKMPIPTTGSNPEPLAAAWTGSQLGLAWLTDPFHVWFALADPATNQTTTPIETSGTIGQASPLVAAYPKGFGLVLSYPMAIPSLAFALRDTSGAASGDVIPLSDSGKRPALAFGGDRFAVVYIDNNQVQLVFIKP